MSDAQAGFGHLGGSWKQHEKQTKRDKRILHGKQGQGRFRAFALCERAEWDSVYLANGSLKQFRVIGTSDNKRQFTITDEKPSKLDGTGTTATLPFSTPANDFYGGQRPGSGLFGDSLVCLDARTGKRIWDFQMVHHGLWDYDLPAAPNLVDIRVNGKPVKAVAQVSKQGFCYVFDRVTGRPIS